MQRIVKFSKAGMHASCYVFLCMKLVQGFSSCCRFYMRFNREGGGYGNDAFISQCQAVAQLFSAMVQPSLLR
jgi:hypothetical protein